MKISLLSALATVLLLAVNLRGQDSDPSDLDKLAGTWNSASAVNNGKPVADETVKKLRLTLTKEGGYKTELGDQVLFDSTCRIDAGKQPKQIDMIGTEGENKGKTAQGIYRVEGDMLTICYAMPGRDRPSTFESDPGSGATLVVWKRVKGREG